MPSPKERWEGACSWKRKKEKKKKKKKKEDINHY